jgi:hypothetical protein
MLTTISLGTCISVQGELVAQLPTGEILVRDGAKVYRGRPLVGRRDHDVPAAAAAQPPAV